MSEQQGAPSALMQTNFSDQMDNLAKFADTLAERAESGEASVNAIKIETAQIKVATPEEIQAMQETLAKTPARLNDTSLIPDKHRQGSFSYSPETVAVEQKKSTEAAQRIAEAVIEKKERVLTDAEIIERVRPFVDSNVLRPIFISKPIQGRVYIGMYPGYAELLVAEKVLGAAPKGDDDALAEYSVLAELSATMKGWLLQHDPRLQIILEHPGNLAKWPGLNRVDFLTAIHPAIREVHVPALMHDYFAWKVDITPSSDELEKFYGLVQPERSS